MPIRKSSAASIDALAADLTSESPVTREAAIARLTVIGPRAVDSLVAIVSRPEKGPTARAAALRALEALGDARALEARTVRLPGRRSQASRRERSPSPECSSRGVMGQPCSID